MVFESVVTDVLNRFLGDYIENLDSKQLKLGIWGGDVVFHNLHLKQNALKELDLPIQTVYGRLEKLVVKIPWQNLYGASVEASIEGLYLLLAPNSQVQYNAEKEEHRAIEHKKSELQKIEDRKKLVEVKSGADDTFVEKLVTQIIKNVQLSIKNIHVRYEDRTTSLPFAMGCTLSNLVVQTTDAKWIPTVVTDAVKQIYKIVTLEGLAVYWNCRTEMFLDLSQEERLTCFLRDIANKQSKPQNYKYVLGPINSEARLILIPKPEYEDPPFTQPKAHAELKIETLSVGISMCQYRDIISFADTMRLQQLGVPYRKYRPHVPYRGHTKEWWMFAFTCILETDVRRRKRNWDWKHMCGHREICKRYGELYKMRLSTKKSIKENEEEMTYCEKQLDLYNLVLIRQRISLEVEILDKIKKEKQPKGWFSGWFGASKQDIDDGDNQDYLKRFQNAMTPEEKQKLFAAIDYNENQGPTVYPPPYIDTIVRFHLQEFKFNIRNDVDKIQSVVKLKLTDVKTTIERRPTNDGIKVTGSIGDLLVTGVNQNDILPEIISSKVLLKNKHIKEHCLVDMMFEMNPLDMINGNRIRLGANALKVVYDAVTINELVKVFKVPESRALDELSQVTALQLSSMKEKSALGLQSVIEKHTKLDIHIMLSAPIILVPYGGLYTETENVLVVNLGTLVVKSIVNNDMKEVQELIKSGFAKTEVMNQMMLQSYDRFSIDLTSVQVLVAQSDENWMENIVLANVTPMHLLLPINISVLLETCIINNDPNMPLSKISAEVPSIHLSIADARLMLALGLVESLIEKLDQSGNEMVRSVSSSSLKMFQDMHEKKVAQRVEVEPVNAPAVQMTLARMKFELHEFRLSLSHQESVADPTIDVCDVKLSSLTCAFFEKTYIREVHIGLESIEMVQAIGGPMVPIVVTKVNQDPGVNTSKDLFKMDFQQVQKKCPDFESLYQRTSTALTIDFATVELNLYHQGLVDLLQYVTDIQSIFNDKPQHKPVITRRSSSASISSVVKSVVKSYPKKNTKNEDINFKLISNLDKIIVNFHEKNPISKIAIGGLNAEVILKEEYTKVVTNLRDITVMDLNPKTWHTVILSVDETQKAIEVEIVLYNDPPSTKPDIAVKATLGRVRISFVYWYLSNMLNFLNSFQTAREAIVAASQKAAQSAKEQMENIYEKATKISLEIKLKAPEIIIPEKSNSLNAVHVDLGYITITNAFNILNQKNDKGDYAIVDEMKLKLVQLKIDSVVLTKTMAVIERVSILQPLSFMLEVNRNLSQWYNSVPDIDLNGIIDKIHIKMGQNDYATIMKIVNENMTEGKVDVYHDTPPEISSKNEEVQVESAFLVSSMTSSLSHPNDGERESEKFVKTNVRWNFAMHSFQINLYNVFSQIADTVKTRVGLAELSMEGFLAKGRMLSNNSISNSLLLMNLSLCDTRPNREGKITELLYRTPQLTNANGPETEENLTESRNMVDMTFQTKQSDTFIDLRVYSFTFLLSVEYLLKLASFFQAATEDMSSKPSAAKKSTVAIEKQKVQKASETNAMISIAVKLEKPDIILVENIDDLNTRALILNCELLMKLRLVGEKQTINGTLSDFQMYTCMFKPEIRGSTKNMFLEPFTLSIAGSTPQDKGLHIEAYMTTIYIGVSVYTIELLNNVLKTISASADPRESMIEDALDMSTLWNMRKNRDNQFWFLQTEEIAEEALQYTRALHKPGKKTSIMNEMCLLNIPQVTLTLQAGVGHKTYPILALESHFHGKVTNWSSQLAVEATLSLQMGYYNNLLALWEPLIEPVMTDNGKGETKIEPWEIRLEVSMNNEEQPDLTDAMDLTQEYNPAPAMTIDISSSSNLELTVTKSGLEVLGNMGKLFTAATSTDAAVDLHHEEVCGLYQIVNTTGMDVILHLKDSELIYKDNVTAKDITLTKDAQIYLDPDVIQNLVENKTFCNYISELKEKYITVEFPKMNCTLRLPYLRAVSRYYRLRDTEVNPARGQWGLVSSVNVVNGVNILTISSILEVHNSFNLPIEMYYMRNTSNELEQITTIQPGTTLHVPLHAVYSVTSELFFAVKGFQVTATPYVWKDLQLNVAVTKNCTCVSQTDNGETFVIKVVGEMKQIYFENTTKYTMASTMYTINLSPAVVVKNCLPYPIQLSVVEPSGTVIQPGDSLEVPNVEPGIGTVVIKLDDYLDKGWVCKREIPAIPPQFSVWTFDSHQSITKMSLDLGMHCMNVNGSYIMSLYCPFWMINKTGLILNYRKSKKTEKNENSGSPLKPSDENTNVIYHPAYLKQPILFSFNARNFFGKKKACIKIGQGDWCDKFSIDVAGSSGCVMCKENGKLYQIGVQNHLTYNGLTKMITFTPYFVIINQSNFTMECQEENRPADPWVIAEPKSCVAFWPVNEREDKLIRIRMQGTDEISIPFLITESHTTLIKLKNKFGGINVDIQLTEGAVYINLTLYDNGMAPALIINNTRHAMNIWEKKSVHIHKLASDNNMFFTWDQPSMDRVLVWEGGYKAEIENELRMDGAGVYEVSPGTQVFWVSFLDGMQRVLLFTEDSKVAENPQSSKAIETIDREITLSLYGLGLSIVNNLKRQEIMYIGIASTGIIWETCKVNSKRFKQMSTKDNMVIEKNYQQYLLLPNGQHVFDFEHTQVDFLDMVMKKPRKKCLRRRFQTGIWLQMKSSQFQMQLHAKINRLQIDNQLYDCTFPVLLAPVPPPKSVVATDANKPFAEVSIVQLLIKNSQIQQYKYFKVLIQEFHVKVDLGFINAIMEVFDTDKQSEEEEKRNFAGDVQSVSDALYSHATQISQQEQKSFYDLLHFSPLKIHISFSMTSQGSGGISNIPMFLSVLLQGIGVTLTDLQDVVFKLAYFERDYSFLTQKQLVSEATKHYVGQTVKQLYVLVLGLDVIGNPYGLVLGITKGVEDLFYEPFQGAIQGPGEFAEGLAFGVASLFGHTFGGAAGAVSRITGAMGKGIAALSFDKEYQRKRRDQINKRPATVKEGLARGGKGLVMGVVDGVTGVFTKPISGAKEQGIGGFFKGLGKGAVGLVARPTAGVMDFASSSLDSVKRATEFGGAYVHRLRPPRFIPLDRLVKPYNPLIATGNRLLCELEKGKYYSTDIYYSHFTVIDQKEVLLLSDKRIAYITHSEIFGGWQVDWSHPWQEIDKPPIADLKGLHLFFETSKKGKSQKLILILDESTCQRIIQDITRQTSHDNNEKYVDASTIDL